MSKLVLSTFGKTFDLLLNILERVELLKGGTLWYSDSEGEMTQIGEESLEGIDYVISDTRKYYKKTLGYVQLYQEQEREIARDLSAGALKVLCIMRSYLKFGNKVYGLTNKFMAEYLSMSERTVSRALVELEDYNLIMVMGKKHNRVFRVNPANTSKGKFSQNRRTLKDFKR